MGLFDELSKLKIIVIGDVMLDRYFWGSVNRISPEAPVPIVLLERTTSAPGGAANVAANLVGLGVTPYLFGIVGNDAEGDLLNTAVSDIGIKNNFIVKDVQRKTVTKTRIVAHNQHVVRIDQDDAEPISAGVSDKIFKQVSELIDGADALIISDYAKGLLTDELLSKLIDLSRRKEKTIIVDPKGKTFAKYKGATLLTPNRREAAEAVGIDQSTDDVVSRSGSFLLDNLDLQAILITEGENGMTLFEKGSQPFHLESWAHDVYDVTGAGDTVIATLAAAIASGLNFTESAKFANAAAGLVVGKFGTTHISTKALYDFLLTSEHGHFIKDLN